MRWIRFQGGQLAASLAKHGMDTICMAPAVILESFMSAARRLQRTKDASSKMKNGGAGRNGALLDSSLTQGVALRVSSDHVEAFLNGGPSSSAHDILTRFAGSSNADTARAFMRIILRDEGAGLLEHGSFAANGASAPPVMPTASGDVCSHAGASSEGEGCVDELAMLKRRMRCAIWVARGGPGYWRDCAELTEGRFFSGRCPVWRPFGPATHRPSSGTGPVDGTNPDTQRWLARIAQRIGLCCLYWARRVLCMCAVGN